MFARLFIIAAVLAGLYFLVRWLRRSSWSPQLGRIALAVGGLGFLLLLTVRGGAEVTLPLLAVLAPWLIRWLKTHSPSPSASSQTGSTAISTVMTPAEAYQILGLSPGASRAAIQSAYRRLIQRLHPDQGGTAYLAAQLNQARDLLLADKAD